MSHIEKQSQPQALAQFFTRAQEARMTAVTTTAEDRLLTAIREFPDFPKLTLADRCDNCSQLAQAQVQVSPDLPNVLLCGHHFRVSLPTFEARGYPYVTQLDEGEDTQFTWASHNKPWPNPFRDAGSA